MEQFNFIRTCQLSLFYYLKIIHNLSNTRTRIDSVLLERYAFAKKHTKKRKVLFSHIEVLIWIYQLEYWNGIYKVLDEIIVLSLRIFLGVLSALGVGVLLVPGEKWVGMSGPRDPLDVGSEVEPRPGSALNESLLHFVQPIPSILLLEDPNVVHLRDHSRNLP